METRKIKFPEVGIDLEKQKIYPGVQIVPIIASTEGKAEINCRFLWEGIAEHAVEIKEHTGGYRVPAVTLVNHSNEIFLAHKGCIIRGGGQNRQLQHSFVIGAAGSFEVAVQCIQKGRWNPQKQQGFSTQGEVTASSLRFYKNSQRQIWETINNAATRSGTLSSSEDYTVLRDYLIGDEAAKQQAASQIRNPGTNKQNGQDDKRQRAQNILNDWEHPEAGQIGIFVTMADPVAYRYGEIIPRYFLEIFSSPQLYARIHREIIASFAVDAIMYDGQSQMVPIDQEKFAQFVASIEQADWTEVPGIGREKRYQLDELADAFGETIFWQERMQHFMYSHCSLQPPRLLAKVDETGQDSTPSPAQVGNYRLLKKLGQGAMGEIYLGQHLEQPLQVALKLLASKLQKDERAVQRFLQEAKVHSRLNHPNIVRIFEGGYCHHSKRMYLAMEYVDGENLEKILLQRQKLLPRHAIKVALAVAQALEHALSLQIIHRDLKPGNILLDRKNRRVKLADLGLGKMSQGEGLTRTGAMMGTPFYMSPEQIRDAKNADHRADIYSLGATLYHMLTGRPPYSEQRGMMAIIRAKIYQDPIPISEYLPEINNDLAALVQKSMARDLEARFASPTEMIAALEKLSKI